MNIVTWKEADDDVSNPCRREENAEASGKTAISKPLPPLPSSSSQCSSSSSSWLRSKDPRIVRVSRAFGGKDRHSKVCTIRGLRDRRVRLSVPTAIQLYDLQERLGVDQPSKVIDWLLDAAKEEIDELPPLPISPESFSLLHRHHHQAFLNLKPGLGPGSGSGQLGFKIGGDSARVVSRTELCNDENEDDEENGKREEHGTVLTNPTDDLLPRMMHQQRNQHHQHVGFDGSCYNMDIHHSGFQTDHHHNHNLVPFPSQILLCPTMAMTTTATIQPLFPSPATVEVIDPRQMINPFQVPGSSQNAPSLYSLMHANNSGSHINIRMPVQFNTANISTTATAISRVLGSESSTSGGSDQRN